MGLELEERDYFKEPFSEGEIVNLAATISVSELFARRSPSLKKMGLSGQELPDAEMLKLMLQEPRLIRRPLVKIGDKMLIGANLKVLTEALEKIG